MLRTKFAITKTWKPSYGLIAYTFTIPKGTRVTPAGGEEFFVDDLSWIKSDSMLRHDATYYGIRLDKTLVEEST